ncbi:MAG TPA: VgrG-related protein [Baekduia sp.]|nr:VgrG-related protein [Baekduia sp.]
MTLPLLGEVVVRVAGKELDLEAIKEARVEQHVLLPDTFAVTLADPEFVLVDDARFAPGADVEISFAGPHQKQPVSVFSGKVAAVEPEFAHLETLLTLRGYDLSHRLNRAPKTRAFQNMTSSDIVRKIAGEAGLKVGRIDATTQVLDFIQQSNETDWRFLWRLAAAADYLIAMDGQRLDFRKAAQAPPGQPVPLVYGESLRQLRPRVSGVQQMTSVVVHGWDPKAKKEITSTVALGPGDGQIGLSRAAAASGLGGGELTIADRPVGSVSEAQALGQGVASRLSNAYLEADGLADGDARIGAGTRLSIDGVGTRFGGTYVVSSAQHVFRGSAGYLTRFTVSGRSTRTLLDLMAPPSQRSWSEGLVVGVVTNNKDPEKLGRVRVRYPMLGQTIESWWARVAAPGAGAGRGVVMTPVAGDEVVVGFEHGDPRRPFVLGAVFNGRAQPGALVHPDGSLHATSSKQLLLESKENMTVNADKDLAVTVKGARTEKVTGKVVTDTKAEMQVSAGGPMKIEGKAPITLKSGATMSVESSGPLRIKAGGSLTIECSGVVRLSGNSIMLG